MYYICILRYSIQIKSRKKEHEQKLEETPTNIKKNKNKKVLRAFHEAFLTSNLLMVMSNLLTYRFQIHPKVEDCNIITVLVG